MANWSDMRLLVAGTKPAVARLASAARAHPARFFNPDLKKKMLATGLRFAGETGFHSVVELFLEQGLDPDVLDNALHIAVYDGNFELIQLLVDFGADIHSVDFEEVCRTGHPSIIPYFLDRGIDAKTGDPFARALRHPKRRDLVIYLRYRNKIPSFKRQFNLALRYHAQKGNLKWVSLLLWAGGDAGAEQGDARCLRAQRASHKTKPCRRRHPCHIVVGRPAGTSLTPKTT